MKKKILMTVITTLMVCTLFSCSSKTETIPDTKVEKTKVVEEKEVITEQKEVEKVQETIVETKTNSVEYHEELQFRVKDSEVIQLPIKVSDLYDKGFYILDEDKNPIDLEEKRDIADNYWDKDGYLIYVDGDGNESKRLDCRIANITENDIKIKDCHIISIYLNDDSQYESDVFFMGDLKIGVSTKEDVVNVLGYPKGIDESNATEKIKEALAFNYDWGRDTSHIHQGASLSLNFFTGDKIDGVTLHVGY